jgi:hypothetical protein
VCFSAHTNGLPCSVSRARSPRAAVGQVIASGNFCRRSLSAKRTEPLRLVNTTWVRTHHCTLAFLLMLLYYIGPDMLAKCRSSSFAHSQPSPLARALAPFLFDIAVYNPPYPRRHDPLSFDFVLLFCLPTLIAIIPSPTKCCYRPPSLSSFTTSWVLSRPAALGLKSKTLCIQTLFDTRHDRLKLRQQGLLRWRCRKWQ